MLRHPVTVSATVRLELCPVTITEAQVFVDRHHRHHDAPQGGLFAVAVSAPCPCNDARDPTCALCEGAGRWIIGVAVIGRPIAPERQDGYTAEITRVCVREGFKNACSMLYGASWRAARSLGYRRIGTYTRKDEPGTSLRAAGYRLIAETRARSWAKDNPSRPRVDKTDPVQRLLWERP